MGGLLRVMSASQFLAWQEYDKLDPIGGPRLDLLAAITATAADNAGRNVMGALTGKHPGPAQPEKYLAKFGHQARPRKSPKELYNLLKLGLRLTGGES